MNTKWIMAASALVLALIGISLTFLPAEISGYLFPNPTPALLLTLQLLGALYFAFALLNWMAKGNALGGVYNRPIALANFAHFFIGALALSKGLIKYPELTQGAWVMTGLYLVFALLFGIVLFRSPVRNQVSPAVN